MAEDFGLSVILRLVDRLSGPMKQVEKTFDKMQDAYKKHGKSLREVGGKMSLYVSAPLIGLGAAAIKTATEFDDAFIEMRKTIQAPAAEVQKMKKSIIDMSKSTPASAEGMMEIAANAARLGIQKDNILGFTKTVSDFATATKTDAGPVSESFARIAKVAGLSQNEFSNLASTTIELSDRMGASEQSILDMALKMGGVGRQVGISQPKIMGMAAAFASLGVEGERGGMALNKVLIQMNKMAAGRDKQSIMQGMIMGKVTGLGAAGFKKLWKEDAVGAVSLFINSLDKWNQKGVDSVQILDAMGMDGGRTADVLLRMAGNTEILRKSVGLGTEAWKENTALTEHFGLESEKAGSKMKILWNNIKIIANQFGEVLLPILIKVTARITPILQKFQELPQPVKEGIIVFGGFLAILGPLVTGLGILAGSLAALGVAASPVLATLAGIALAIAAITTAVMALKKAWENLKSGDVMGSTTYGLIQNAILGKGTAPAMGKEGARSLGSAANVTALGGIKNLTEITLRVLADKAVAVSAVDKKKGDGKVNVISQGYLGLAGAQ